MSEKCPKLNTKVRISDGWADHVTFYHPNTENERVRYLDEIIFWVSGILIPTVVLLILLQATVCKPVARYLKSHCSFDADPDFQMI